MVKSRLQQAENALFKGFMRMNKMQDLEETYCGISLK